MTELTTTPGCGSELHDDEDDEPLDPRYCAVLRVVHHEHVSILSAWIVDRWAAQRRPLTPARYR